ncbi:superfamily II DNA/RNA helicase [Cryobacterium mesophilum]|uniref:DEAD/DEAH box helicase n=1 Tax=Terrimesophilobacter mesophilus TaxID=433647 RepID=A0A4R8VAF6_9MICO|nr:DEAD/DEAH box helicase [Terrimesophilobacter mesophilus]MBB5632976.1 superfamily II DNA/RNA helicase [Terrimesophilobacter mesophilus]TFB79743.1 DEAD/DEAH box helicase [Terrimesophilobacter mesophilus]
MTESTFGALGVPTPLVAVLTKAGIESPFPIQEDTLPDTLRGRDVLGRGKTGSGKTLAFSLPMVARLKDGGRPQSGRPRGLILAPTRELATQITATLAPLASAYGMSVTTIFGGVSQQRQVAALKAGVDIVVACPGRLEDLMQQKFVTLDAIEITVLDEADHMADLGFLPVVTRILNKTPDGGQRMLFSATLDNGVDKLVNRYLHNEILHSVDDATSHVEAMTHHVFEVDGVDAKKDLVQALASGTGRRILFMRTKHHAKKLAKHLTEAGIPSVDLHGNLSQPQRDRNLATFASGEARVLVATDVAARGIDIGEVELVVHVDPPAEHKAYLHRSGRTARAGSSGDVVTVVLPAQRADVAALLRKAAIAVAPQRVTSTSPAVTELIGEVAVYVKPAPREAKPLRHKGQGGQPQGGRSQGANAQRKRANRELGNGHSGGRVADGRSAGSQVSDAPRRDRSGRPAASGSGQGARAGQARAGQARSGQARTGRNPGGSQRSFTSYSTSTPTGGARRTGRRAQG